MRPRAVPGQVNLGHLPPPTDLTLTLCLHFTAGCTTGCVKYAKWRLSGPAETFMTSWRRVAQQGGCVDSIQCGACDGNFVQKTFFNYLFFYRR